MARHAADEWTDETFVIWGKTYPELSRRYDETVCTGAVRGDRPGLLRIYPIAHRYLEGEQRFKKWSIVSAKIKSNPSDARPESYRINASTIKVKGTISTADAWRERLELLLRPEHMFSGIEELERRQKEDRTSLGIVKPAEIMDVSLQKVSNEDREAHRAKYEKILQQRDLWEAGRKPMPCPTHKPRVRFRCSGDSKPYDRLILDWEIAEFVKRHKRFADPEQAFREGMFERAFSQEHDPYLVLGNISNYPHTFVVVAVIYPKKRKPAPPKAKTETQRRLF